MAATRSLAVSISAALMKVFSCGNITSQISTSSLRSTLATYCKPLVSELGHGVVERTQVHLDGPNTQTVRGNTEESKITRSGMKRASTVEQVKTETVVFASTMPLSFLFCHKDML